MAKGSGGAAATTVGRPKGVTVGRGGKVGRGPASFTMSNAGRGAAGSSSRTANVGSRPAGSRPAGKKVK